ncbi:S-layer homology domain-containing protein [Paenibacillaceae bacterium]|nr:S-layer homology domain-containing protein [Paenibacillaceae bacterium]
MAAMLVRAYELAAGKPAGTGNVPAFKDEQQVSGWAQTVVQQAVFTRLMQGKGAGKFAPGSLTTREEAIQAIYNLLQLTNQE